MGLDQHFGGLDTVRRWVYEQPNWQDLAPDYLRRIQSDRIFSTLFYPNALAGVILLLGPAALVVAVRACARQGNIVRGVAVGLLGYAALGCLYWSGSKSAWLIAVLLASLGLVHGRLEPRVRRWLTVGLVALALAGFALRYSNYFQRGAPSAVARLDYWRAAVATTRAHPWFGTGPGTFAVPYRQLKGPEAEMARLVHNDYLQQASDSGLVGSLAYTAFIGVSLARLRRRCATDPLRFAAWLGLVGWACQSCVEFGLYIPALSWLPFALLGWLWSVQPKQNPLPPERADRAQRQAGGPERT
jgi:O-antigen ligase